MKVEPQRWYYWADRIGLMVWQDMPSTRSGTTPDKAGRSQLESELPRHNRPAAKLALDRGVGPV